MKTTSFTPSGASARVFQPRLWLAVQPNDQKSQAGQELDTPCLWDLLIFNGGPELLELVVEFQPEESEEPTNRFEIPLLEENAVAHLFGGGPSEEPPHGTYRAWAKTTSGVIVSLATQFTGLVRPTHVPAFVDEHQCFPLAPAASWHPDEFVQVLEESYLHTGRANVSPASLAFSRRISRLLRGVESIPSEGAAREIIWSAVRGVFGAHDGDLERPDVRQKVEDLIADVQELAGFLVELRNPLTKVPDGEVSFALAPGERPALYLINTYEQDLKDVRVELQRFRWGVDPVSLEPRVIEVGRVAANTAALVVHLEDALDFDLECTAITGPIQGFCETRHRSLFPEDSLDQTDSLFHVDHLEGRTAQIRRTESSAIIEPTNDEEGPGKLAA